jgi:hypothetical protein
MKRYPPLDASKFFGEGSDKNSFTIPSTARIKNTPSVNDIYFVFKKSGSATSDALFPLAEIELQTENVTSKR